MIMEALQNLSEAEADEVMDEWRQEGIASVKIEQADHLWTVMTIASPEATGSDDSVRKPDEHDPELGTLSERFESNGEPGAVGRDKKGGYSYGQYQIATRPGTMKVFLEFLYKVDPDAFTRLNDAGGLTDAMDGTDAFKSAWKDLAKDLSRNPSFGGVQHAFIQATHYEPFVNRLAGMNLMVNERSNALKNVVWSTAVQHGPGNTVFKNALDGRNPANMNDAEIIEAVYDERSKVELYFSGSDAGVKKALLVRFRHERSEALKMLPS
ncbi:MAG: hypothetical protein ABFD97_24035 [Syntrophobacter sp.]